MGRQIPKNVRQIGNVSDSSKIYIEDYVDIFLNQLCEKTAEKYTGAFLVGEVVEMEDVDYIYVNGVEMALEPMKPEETAELIDYLYKLDSLCIYNETIYNIVMEEAAGFLEGQKTAEEVADVIQSRVEIYVSENS